MDDLISHLIQLDVSEDKARAIVRQLQIDIKILPAEECWQKIVHTFLIPHQLPFTVHWLLYQTIYPHWESEPDPAWLPDEKSKATHIAQLIAEGFHSYADLHAWSVRHYQDFWVRMIKILNIQFSKPYERLVDLNKGVTKPLWFPGAQLNIVNSCLQASQESIAIVYQSEQGEWLKLSYDALNKLTNRIANSLSDLLKKGDKAAIIMPMTVEAVALYLGILKAGGIVVAIPDSFSHEEIATRLKIANVKVVFCQDQIIRDNKILPLYERIETTNVQLIVVIPAMQELACKISPKDLTWNNFLKSNEEFEPVICEPNDAINILFSSGTTGEPKAIPWSHSSAIKCASDAYLHHDVHPGDVFCWPTNLGWMMGPWLIFASLINGATIALYGGAPNGKGFGRFVQDAKVTHLGVVPTMVKTWRNSNCMAGLDWQNIKLFTSTGERSNIEDMLYLMSLAAYRPIIEYCGGTEIAGAYITGTLVQPAAPASFTTPALGLDFLILDEQGRPADNGEVAIIPPSLGLSTELLNKNHEEIYYAGMPTINNKVLRRHGDQIKKYANGFYRLLGRTDDTMKLGGIKVSSAEIETVLNQLPYIIETAAIAVNPKEGGPSQLIIYVVLKDKIDLTTLKVEMQQLIKTHLNPLFKIYDIVLIDALPRTASNKVMRRTLRDQYQST